MRVALLPVVVGLRVGRIDPDIEVICQSEQCLQDAVLLVDDALFGCARNISDGQASLKQLSQNFADTNALINVLEQEVLQGNQQEPVSDLLKQEIISLNLQINTNSLERAKVRLARVEENLRLVKESQKVLVERCHNGLPQLTIEAKKIARGQGSSICIPDVSKWKPTQACAANSCGAKQTWASQDACNNITQRFLECPCCARDAIYNENLPWSDCSKPCGAGIQERTRTILQEATCGGHEQDIYQQRLCNTHSCDGGAALPVPLPPAVPEVQAPEVPVVEPEPPPVLESPEPAPEVLPPRIPESGPEPLPEMELPLPPEPDAPVPIVEPVIEEVPEPVPEPEDEILPPLDDEENVPEAVPPVQDETVPPVDDPITPPVQEEVVPPVQEETPVVEDVPLPPLPTEEDKNEEAVSPQSNMDELMKQVAAAAMAGAAASAFDS